MSRGECFIEGPQRIRCVGIIHNREVFLSAQDSLGSPRNLFHVCERVCDCRGRNAELARQGCRGKRIQYGERAGERNFKTRAAESHAGIHIRHAVWFGVFQSEGKRLFDGKREEFFPQFVVRICYDVAWSFGRCDQRFSYGEFCTLVIFKRAMRLDMLPRDVGEDEGM